MRSLFAADFVAFSAMATPPHLVNPTYFDTWTIDQVTEFVRNVGTSSKWSAMANQFENDGFDGLVFGDLRPDDLALLGYNLSFAKPLLRKRDEERRKGNTYRSVYQSTRTRSYSSSRSSNCRRMLDSDEENEGPSGRLVRAQRPLKMTKEECPTRAEFDMLMDRVASLEQALAKSLSSQGTGFEQQSFEYGPSERDEAQDE